MSNDRFLQQFPVRRVKPLDGMAVTAAVWDEAHEYHRQLQRFHSLYAHGPGIVTGLEVIASDPADTTVYVLPGIAVDPHGQTIIVTQPVSYRIAGAYDGVLHLLLSYGESRPRTENLHSPEGSPLFIHSEFGLQAGSMDSEAPYVELARILRRDSGAPIVNARDALQPAVNEIDLRFRKEIGAKAPRTLSVAVSYAGGENDQRHGRGALYLARALSQEGRDRVCVDNDVSLTTALKGYTLVYLVGRGAFRLSRDEMNALYEYLQTGGTVLYESCRHDTGGGDPAADSAFRDLLASLGIQLQEVRPGDELLTSPALFAAPPTGFETQGTPTLMAGGGVIFSTFDYGCLWHAERRGRAPTREEIRTAMEWGGNILAYAATRRRESARRARGQE